MHKIPNQHEINSETDMLSFLALAVVLNGYIYMADVFVRSFSEVEMLFDYIVNYRIQGFLS